LRIFSLEPPQNIITLVSGNVVNLRWDPAQGASIYNIYKRKKGDSSYRLLNSVQDARYSDSSVKIGEEYEYVVSAKDIAGKESARSEAVFAKIQPAEVPKDVKKYKIDPWATSRLVGVEMPNFTNDIAVHGTSAVASMDFLVYFPDVTSGDFTILLKKKGGFGGVGFGPDGKLYAGNQNERLVYVIDPVANAVLATYTIPAPGKGVLKYEGVSGKEERNNNPRPYDVAVDASGNLYVTDTANFRVAKLSPQGKYLGTMGFEEGSEDWQVTSLSFIAIDPEGRKYVTGYSEIHVFSADDRFLGILGKAGQEFGAFSRPRGVAFDERKNIYVSDSMGNNVQVFRENEKEKIWEPVHLLSNETKDGNPSWATPTGIGLLPDGSSLVVSESMGKRVSVFGIKR
jgi:DNA-binding beta-propeller fold protein YncE